MIIIASKEGQFANRVIHFLHIYSFCKANSIKLHHLYFEDYKDYFPNLENEPVITIHGRTKLSKKLRNLFQLFVRGMMRLKILNLGFIEIIPYLRYDQEAPIYDLSKNLQVKAKRKIVILYGWLFRDPKNFKLLKGELTDVFKLKEAYYPEINKRLHLFRDGDKKIIGIHIRKGDYKIFEGGKWYYENSVYKEKMLECVQTLQLDFENAIFILCSNEPIDPGYFKPLNTYAFQSDFITDFIALMQSDYILGPPSTFSALASFWGNVPLQHIYTASEKVSLSNFEVYNRI